ncbi:GlmU family protein [Pedobacter duraquae]|uniref:UDP-N-acetylglucosamine diphosphorylase/glucosamine-1-phosphate N-acetyltransferase n=1 Tax=Pedobacter duraquae TaxID=425511 RepID=A0A4R6IPZ5_9SPHI|nr:GlmU family protein [Pedobacter duraquae]TDO24382.1 UDP-N-acetylglucosamine diphosphorylase/glucosamine-1-phosphate N-acetyltransferase [Pedobacter duraquae]
MIINLFDDTAWESLRPLTLTRPVADLRIGILTIAEKWARTLNAEKGFVTQPYLQLKYPALSRAELFINGSVCPDPLLIEAITCLKSGEQLEYNSILLAFKISVNDDPATVLPGSLKPVRYTTAITKVSYPEDIFKWNDSELKKDFQLITKGRSSAAIDSSNALIGEDIFLEEGAETYCATLNSKSGPIYLGKNSQIWEGTNIRGSFALCEHSQVKMGTKIYGQTTIGPYCRVGGEINNAVIWGYSSKGHEGYLGNAVLGQWCNIGADSNNSNLKNNYAEVKLWDYAKEGFRKTGLQFCGLIMGDHSKCGINTMFNTGTVTGVSANVFGAGFPRNFIPDFAWGGAQGFEVYSLPKMFETAKKVFERRDMIFDETEQGILEAVFNSTKQYRHF